MRFSNPITASRLRRPISESTTATFFPCIARAVPRFAVVVVLPTPPFPEVIVSTRLSIHISLLSNCSTISILHANYLVPPSRRDAAIHEYCFKLHHLTPPGVNVFRLLSRTAVDPRLDYN